MRQEIRVNFTGQTQLDNGITVGVLVGLNGESVAKSDSDEQYRPRPMPISAANSA